MYAAPGCDRPDERAVGTIRVLGEAQQRRSRSTESRPASAVMS
jgi:hypothetical protein